MRALSYFPLLTLVVAGYTIAAFAAPTWLAEPFLQVTLLSGAELRIAGDHVFLLMALAMLYIEIFKATRSSESSIVEHGLSMGVFVVALIEFLAVAAVGTPTFLALVVICLLDVIGGFTVSISAARRDVGLVHER